MEGVPRAKVSEVDSELKGDSGRRLPDGESSLKIEKEKLVCQIIESTRQVKLGITKT